jgi:cytochrome c553
MKRWKTLASLLLVFAILAAIYGFVVIRRGFSANAEPSSLEKLVARTVRNISIPSRARDAKNPWKPTLTTLNEARADFADRCAICHGTDGSGGTPISWRPFGTLWTRNITAHPQAGVGAWSDMELERAIRSGVSRDGRQLHWQGMTWDQLSNLDEEDLRAIVAYVRLLPPVDRAVPLPRPPTAGDCETYTYYLEKSDQPGCR